MPSVVERRVRLVEDQQLRLVEQCAAEREPLRHAARERRHALVSRLPEPEALEQHARALPPLGHPVEAAVEIEVLERSQLAVAERLVAEEPDRRARGIELQLTAGRRGQTGAEPEQRRLPGAVRPGDEQEPASRQVDVDAAKHAPVAVALDEAARLDHASTSRSTKPKKTRLITPFIVKNAMFSRRWSAGETSSCS